MEIISKAVKCGDCNILRGTSDCLLIDCGSDNRGNFANSAAFSFSKIRREVSDKSITDIMVSHFHKDHFIGILKIPDTYSINTAYLPYSIIDGKVLYSEGIGRLLAVASPRSWGFQLSKNIIGLFKKLNAISKEVRFVKKGDFIPFDKNRIRILWPDVTPASIYMELPIRRLDKSDVPDSIRGNELSSIEKNIRSETDSSLSYFDAEKKLSSDFDRLIGERDRDLLATTQEFIGCFSSFLIGLHNEEKTEINTTIAAYERLMQQRKLFRDKIDESMKGDINHLSLQQYHSLVTCMNAISIICDCGNRFLFLGDAPAKIIEHIVPSCKKRYTFVKVQHHGTSPYFTKKTPKGAYNLISNGGHTWRKICENNVGLNTVICTDAHINPHDYCKYVRTARTGSCSSKCIKVVNGQHITSV
ncbi:MAG: MBL fold metallo-hydrolase [Oscillospiraceae bacterium]|nr:MBL fold metallo-hydrolase [Oscillospiraceae bacterium]